MQNALAPLKLPLRRDCEGTIRVGGSRVSLDVVVADFENGSTAEEIAQRYQTITLKDVYCTIAYYLQHTEELRPYLEDGRKKAEAAYAKIEARFPRGSLRSRLLARGARPGA